MTKTAMTATPRSTGAPDVPYDGVDADCDGGSDYDGDGDGMMPSSSAVKTAMMTIRIPTRVPRTPGTTA